LRFANIRTFLARHPRILGEGAVIERLRRESPFPLDEQVVNSAFIYTPEKRAAIADIYRQYLEIGRKNDLPMILSTPTWRASAERIAAAGLAHHDLNADNFRFMDDLRRQCGRYGGKILICGLMSCRGNAYNPDEALPRSDARSFHQWQADKLAATGVDFIMAATLPAFSEALGLAEALAATGKPYVVSFVVRRAGTLLDGTSLHEAITRIDRQVRPAPLAYMINCTHPRICRHALGSEQHASGLVRTRILGLLANTADLEPEELDEREELVSTEPAPFATEIAELARDFDLTILGGCCGTDDRHIAALARALTA